MNHLFCGLDLGWTTGATGLAAVDASGRLLLSGRVRTDEEIAAWIEDLAGQLFVVAVDAPIIVPNETGQREPERLIGKAFGAFGASAHTSNRVKFGGEPSRALRLAKRFGWWVDPTVEVGAGRTVCIEVYPHPAMVGLFGLGYRLDYKKGNDAQRKPGFLALVNHLQAVPELRLTDHPRWAELRRVVDDPGPGDLNRLEDELDAILCAHLAWLWHHRREALHMYGSVKDGYIVATPPPSHQAVLPKTAPSVPATPPGGSFVRRVVGRPTGYSSGEQEMRWKQAVRDAFVGVALPVGVRAEVELDFMLAAGQHGRSEPDLDNLIKSTVDALEGVLGVRAGTGARVEADDVRIDRIVATKRHCLPGEEPGARVSATARPEVPPEA